MQMNVASQVETGSGNRSTWRRMVVEPVVAQLKQGISPEKLALTVAIGGAIAVFPVLGTTTTLCLIAGITFKLNQPLLQLVNYLLYPVQLALVVAFIRAGEFLFGAPRIPFSVADWAAKFHASPARFCGEFAMTLVHSVVGWAVTVPPTALVVYYLAAPLFRKLSADVSKL
jgi:uncharacterized protein (DUF2062 family)